MNQYVSQGVFDRRVKLIEEKLKNIYDNDLLNRLQAEQEEFIKRLKEIELDGSIPDYFIADYNAFKANTLRIDDVYDANGQFDGSKIKPLSISTAALTVGQRSQQLSLTGVEFSVTPYSHSGGYYGTLEWSGGSMFHYGFINENSEPKVYTITSGSFALGNSAYYIYAYIANLESTTTTAEIKVSANQIKVDGEGKPNDFPNGYYVQLGYVSVELDSGSSESSNRYYRKVDTTYGQTTINGRLITTGRIEGNGAYFDLDTGDIGGTIKFKDNNSYISYNDYIDSKISDYNTTLNNTVIKDLKKQVDGAIDTWFYDYMPVHSTAGAPDSTTPLNVVPYKTWNDIDTTAGNNNEKIKHLGDIFYDNTSGYAFRFSNTGTEQSPTFVWETITDSAVIKALADAATAQATADGKLTIFASQPTIDYKIGDLWNNAVYSSSETYTYNGKTYKAPYDDVLLVCIRDRVNNTFSITDWIPSDRSIEGIDAAKGELTAIQNGTTTIAGGMITNNLLELKNIVGVTKQFKNFIEGRSYYKRISNKTVNNNVIKRFLKVTISGTTYPNYNLYEIAQQGDINTIDGIIVQNESATTGTSATFKATEFYYGGGEPGLVTAGLSGIEDFPCYWSGGDEVLARDYIRFKKAWLAAPNTTSGSSYINYVWQNSDLDFIYDWTESTGQGIGTYPIWKKNSSGNVLKANFATSIVRYYIYKREGTRFVTPYDTTPIDTDYDIPRLPVVIIDFDGFCKFGEFCIYNGQAYYNNASGFGHYALTLNGQQNGSGTSLGSFYAPNSAGTNGYILKSNGSGEPTWLQTLPVSNGGTGATTFTSGYLLTGNGTSAMQAYQPSWQSWVAGTSSGPKAKIKLGNVDYTSAAIPSASATASGIITNDEQFIGGIKKLYREGTTANNYPSGLKFYNKDTTTGQQQDTSYIFAYNTHSSDNYGMNLVIQSAGNIFIGGGESPSALYSTLTTSTSENLYCTADNGIYLESNAGTIANRIGVSINTSGAIVPVKAESANNNAQNIGASNNKWANVYATTFNGDLSGNADTATTWQNSRTLTIGATGKSVNGSANVSWNTTEINRIQLTSSLSGRVVIALCKLSASSTAINYGWSGNIYASRGGQDDFTQWARVDITAIKSLAYGFRYTLITSQKNTSTSINTSTAGFRACRFQYTKDGVQEWYGGIEFYNSWGVRTFNINGIYTRSSFEPFVVQYATMSNSTATATNTEIYNSIDFSSTYCIENDLIYKGTINGYTISSTINAGTANRLAYYTSSGIDDANTTYVSNTKLAINSTSEPSYNLYVNGTSCFNDSLNINSAINTWAFHVYNKNASATTPFASCYIANGNTGNGMWLGTSVNSSSYYIANFRYGATGDGAGGTSALYVRADGNIGIGTESPAYKLDVSGDINTSSYVRSIRFLTKASSNANYAGLCAGNQITGLLTADDGALYYYGKKLWVWATELRLEGGNFWATGSVTALQTSSSDKRLKKNIKQFNAKQIIDKLNPVEFEWNKKANKYNSNLELNKKNYGLIAQDSDGIIDDLVFDLPDGKRYKGVRYEKLIPILLQAVKEQQKEIDELKSIVKQLKNK